MDKPKDASNEQAALMAEMEVDALRQQITELHEEIAELHREADLDSCHIAGLSAQIKALLAESEACPDKVAHQLIERADYRDSRTGETISKTRALPIYREAFDAEAEACGIDHPERYRS
jgi:uncharacterized coiled-coil DUF342 family protein